MRVCYNEHILLCCVEKMKSRITKILICLFAVVFLFAGWKLFSIYRAYASAKAQYENLEQFVSFSTVPPSEIVFEEVQEQETSEDIPEIQEAEPLPIPQVDFSALREINPDIVGWLFIESTRINYPVVQGIDNNFYLRRQFDGEHNSAGCLFLDAANDASFEDFNQIIYGHHMNDGSMFRDLIRYDDQAFFEAHPIGWFITPSAVYRLDFFSSYVSDVLGDAWTTDFAETDYAEWLVRCKEQSRFDCDVIPTANDCILTLSTCSYVFQNARFVLHAVLQKEAVFE